jgi:uncharacterized protein
MRVQENYANFGIETGGSQYRAHRRRRCLAARIEDRPILIETPCIKICVIDGASQLCIGCGRSLDEIAQWATLNPQQRARVMMDLAKRLVRLREARPKSPGEL